MTHLKEDVICYCSGTTKGQISTLIMQGITELDIISRLTGACSGCGACDVEIIAFIADEHKLN
jgi:bacterioferritin-associated ferredoxin